ncbi:DnaJ protein ERDJ3A [Glycine soja]
MSDDEREEKELDLSSAEVVTKYKTAAEIVNKALKLVISECKPKAKIVDICEKGDSYIREQTGNVYKNVKRKIERGVAFPTCLSVNNVVCHFSPLASDEAVLEEGDILKIDMACHIDGFIAAVAHTHVLQEGPVTGRAADVIAAANTAAEVALRLVRPGKKVINCMGGQGGSKSFSFSVGGGSGDSNPFGFGLDDLFGSFFGGGGGGSQFGGFGSSAKSQSGSKSSSKSLRAVNSQIYKKEIENAGMTWLLLSYMPSSMEIQYFESTIEEVASSLHGALKVGSINCEKEVSFCKELSIYPRRAPRLIVFSYKENEKGYLVEYRGDLAAKNLKAFCQEYLPRFSKRTDLNHLDQFSTTGKLPRVLLLSTKKDTPVIWRVLSGLYHKRITFIDAEVHDVSDPRVKTLGVDALPAIVGQAKEAQTDSDEGRVPLLSKSNIEALCGEKTPVCIIGAFRSSKAREKLESILSLVSPKSLSRRPNQGSSSSRDSISYALLDAAKQKSFLKAFDKTGYKSSNNLLIAYKPRRGKYSIFMGEMTIEEIEKG